MDQVLDGVWVLLGAAIAALTTWLFNRSTEYESKKRVGFSLFIKTYRAVNDMMRMHRDLEGQMENFNSREGQRPSETELWSAITPFVGVPIDVIEFTGEELAVLGNDGASIGRLLEFATARQVLFDTVRAYNDKRSKLGDALALLSTFSHVDGLKAESTFDARERPRSF